MKNSLVYSCDTYFYNLALKIGIDTLVKYAEKLGFGAITGIELKGEKQGLLPSPEWKRKTNKGSWQRGDTLNFCIGQGFLQATPLQIATIYSGIANNGTAFRPNLLRDTNNKQNKGEDGGEIFKKYSLSDETFLFLKDALHGVVSDQHGTGYNARIPGVLVAGKTGTAQVVSLKNKPPKGKPVPRHLENHAWFVAFSPVAEPEIVVCVFLEHGGGGGKNAAPIAREVIRAYYDYKNSGSVNSVN
jgi:penicillin-binding protein 2